MLKMWAFNAEESAKPLQYALLCALLSLSFGYDLGQLFVNQQFLNDFFILSGNEGDVILGTFILGLILGFFLGGFLNYGSGRRLCLLCGAALGILSIIASMFAPNLSILLCTQFVIGFAAALFLFSAILYCAEITLPRQRGLACCLPWVLLSGGIFLAVITREINPIHGMPLMALGLCIFNLLLLIIAVLRLPESPRYLASVGQSDRALSVLFRLRLNMSIAARELAGINEGFRQETRGAQFFFQSAAFRYVFWTLICLTLLLHASGLTLVPFALSDLFLLQHDVVRYQSYDLTYGLLKAACAVVFFGTVTAALMADRIGRRVLLCGAALLINLALLLLFLGFLGSTLFFAPLFITLGVLLYIYAATILLVGLLALLLPELSPGRGREFAAICVLITSAVASLFVMQVYYQLVAVLGFTLLFGLCLLCSALLTLLCLQVVPNTSSASLEGIENRLMEGVPLRSLGRLRDRRDD